MSVDRFSALEDGNCRVGVTKSGATQVNGFTKPSLLGYSGRFSQIGPRHEATISSQAPSFRAGRFPNRAERDGVTILSLVNVHVNLNKEFRMTKAQAWKEAQRRWGKRAIIEHNRRALTESEKAPIRKQHRAAREELKVIPRTPETALRRGGLLREERRLFGLLIADRYQVGELMDILNAFHVKGSGDTWEQAFAKASERYPNG